MSQQAQERMTDGLAGASLTAGISVNLTDFNVILETATLTVGLVAGIFALFFQIRRWRRGRAANAAVKKALGGQNEPQ